MCKSIFILALITFCVHSHAENVLSNHIIRTEKFWEKLKPKNFAQKVNLPVPAELIEYLHQDNELGGWSERPKAAVVTPDFLKDLKSAIAGIPRKIIKKIDEKLIGIFIVTDLGGTAYSEYVTDGISTPKNGFVVLDMNALNKKANEWATWKESSPFHYNNEHGIEAIIADKKQNTRANAIQYILLHEFGHVLAIGSSLLPPSAQRAKDVKLNSSMGFFNLSWKVKDEKYTTKYDEQWVDRSRIRYYATSEKKLESEKAIHSYRNLVKSNFATLYAVTNPFDDFAESFVNYVHVIIMKKPWEIRITTPTDTILYKPCWQEARCDQKKALIESVLKN